MHEQNENFLQGNSNHEKRQILELRNAMTELKNSIVSKANSTTQKKGPAAGGHDIGNYPIRGARRKKRTSGN